MGIIERIKKLFKKKIIVNETNLARIDTDLLFVRKFEELTENNQAKVLKYLQEVNIKDLDTIIDYTKNLTEEANFNSEFLLKLYYRLTDDDVINKKDMQSDVYQTTIEINELNLCKSSLLKLREEGILRIIALNELYKQETSRKLSFAGIFGRLEKAKRINELKSLKDLTERLKISVKVIEQLIQVININVDADGLKVIYQENLLKLLNSQDSEKIINDLILETRTYLKIFLPKYEKKFNFNPNNVEECIMTLSIARRLLDLYAYKHKDDAISIIGDINELCNNACYEKDDDKIMEDILIIESKYKVFKPYLSDNELVTDALKKLYKIKFPILLKNINTSFRNIKNKFELSCYEELVSTMLEDILKGNNALFKIDPNLPKISNDMQNELNQIISLIFKYSNFDLSKTEILADLGRLKIIMSLSNEYNMSFEKRLSFIKEIENVYLPKHFKKKFDNYIDYDNYLNSMYNTKLLQQLFKIFVDYEAYNKGKEMPYSFDINLEKRYDSSVNSILARIYLDILQNSRLCILLPGIKNISEEFFLGGLSSLPVEKIVFSECLNISRVFNDCPYLKCVDIRKLYNEGENSICNNPTRIKIKDCFSAQDDGYFYLYGARRESEPITLLMDYNFIELFLLDEQLYKTYEEWYAENYCKIDNSEFKYQFWELNREKYKSLYTDGSRSEPLFILEEILKSFGFDNVNGNINRLVEVYGLKEFPIGKVKPFNIVVYKDGQSYNIDVARLFALRLKNDRTHTKVIKIYPLANTIIDEVNKREKCLVKHL